jgi:transcriptional regulator with XRE-family HTH domain
MLESRNPALEGSPKMGKLGETLRDARRQKGWSLAQVEGAIRIRQQYLAALEKEHFAEFASESQIRGFLRTYALYLGLDPEEILEYYDEEPRKISRRPSIPRPSSLSPWSMMNLLILVFIIVIIGIMGLYVASRQTTPPPPPPTPTSAPVLPARTIPRYVLQVSLDYEGHSLDASERLDFINLTDDTLRELAFNVFPNHAEDVFLLRSVALSEVGEEEEEVPELEYDLNGTSLRVHLPTALEQGDELTLFLEFSLDLPRMNPYGQWGDGSLGYSDRMLAVGNWYPALVPYREGQGWQAFAYHAVGDPYVTEVADYEVEILAPSGITVVGTGDEEQIGNRWRYTISEARSFAFAASDQYLSSSEQAGHITVSSYYFAAHESSGADAASAAADALTTFEELFGSYPYSIYRIAEVDFAGGMEFSTMCFLGDDWYGDHPGGYRSGMVSLIAHEASHQWWYGVVGSDQVREPWLDEALATYSSMLYYERRHPELVEWWWEAEVDRYRPLGQIDRPVYAFMDGRTYLNAVYRRGALFIRDIRSRMGDDVFFAFLRDYYESRGKQLSTAEDFFAVLHQHTEVDISSLLEEYLGP